MEKQLIEALQKQVQLLEQLVRAKDQLILELQLKQIPQIPQYPQIVPQNPWSPWSHPTLPYIVTCDNLVQLVQPLHCGENGR